jgi:exosortase/archaeosortase family protein
MRLETVGKRSGIAGPAQLLYLLWRDPAALALVFSVLAISIDYLIAPALNVITPPLACGLLAALLLRAASAESTDREGASPAQITDVRLQIFLLLHAALMTAAMAATAQPTLVQPRYGILFSAAKYLVLLPTLVLLPLAFWVQLLHRRKAECAVAALALLTLYPHRVFTLLWPWYSQGLGAIVYSVSRPFVAGLEYVSTPGPKLLGPELHVSIVFGCSGLLAVGMFQTVFALALLVDWPVVSRRRALLGYFSGLAIMLCANVLRIILVVVLGNHLAPELVARYHMLGGWMFFGLVVAVCAWFGYGWLVGARSEHASRIIAPQATSRTT